MNKKDLFKNIIEQNIPDKDETLSIILTKAQIKTENAKTKSRANFSFKQIVKYTLPVAMVLTIAFVTIFHSAFSAPVADNNIIHADTNGSLNAAAPVKTGNWFSLSVYAMDETSQSNNIIGNKISLQKDIAVKLPNGLSSGGIKYFKDGAFWDTAFQPFRLTIEGENIKSIRIKDENNNIGLTESNLYIAKISQDILPWEQVIIGDIRGSSYTNLEKLKEYWDSGILDDIKEEYFQGIGDKFDYYFWMGMQSDENLENGEWQLYAVYGNEDGRELKLPPPEKSIVLFNDNNQNIFTCSVMRWFSYGKVTIDEAYQIKHDFGGDIIYSEAYSNDRITITVTFDDGEKLTQTLELTINQDTCETFLKIIE